MYTWVGVGVGLGVGMCMCMCMCIYDMPSKQHQNAQIIPSHLMLSHVIPRTHHLVSSHLISAPTLHRIAYQMSRKQQARNQARKLLAPRPLPYVLRLSLAPPRRAAPPPNKTFSGIIDG